MLEMVKDKIEEMINFLKKEKVEYKRANAVLNGYLIALREFNLITFEEGSNLISKFCVDYLEASKEDK